MAHLRKLSEMIFELADGFIAAGETPEERQGRLNFVCSAWNMACSPPEKRHREIEGYVQRYRQMFPSTPLEEVANIRNDLQLLINRKLQLFAGDRRPIVGARIVPGEGTRARIEVTSARMDGDPRFDA